MAKKSFVKEDILKEISMLFDIDMKYGIVVPETIEVKSIENAKIVIIKDSLESTTIYLEDILENLLKSKEGRIELIKAIQKMNAQN